jgi:hypothetical protein
MEEDETPGLRPTSMSHCTIPVFAKLEVRVLHVFGGIVEGYFQVGAGTQISEKLI